MSAMPPHSAHLALHQQQMIPDNKNIKKKGYLKTKTKGSQTKPKA